MTVANAPRTCDDCKGPLVPAGDGLLACHRCRHVEVAVEAASVSLSDDAATERTAPRIDFTPEMRERFLLGRVIGRGGMGLVLQARDRGRNRPVAIKFLTRLGDECSLQRFLQEGRILTEIRHTNVLSVLEAGLMEYNPYLVCELADGGTLRDRMDREGRVPAPSAVPIVLGCLDGLAALHARGIVHRDVKPQNILFDRAGRPKIADLGLAKDYSEGADKHLTSTGIVLGTPKYMSPEQARGEKVGVPGDLYSLAVVLYEMLCGEPPFEDDSIFVLITKHMESAVPALRSRAPEVPVPLAEVVHQALAKDPAERPQSAEEFSTLLKKSMRTRAGAKGAAARRGAADGSGDGAGGAGSGGAGPVSPAGSTGLGARWSAGRPEEGPSRPLALAGFGTLAVLIALSFALTKRPGRARNEHPLVVEATLAPPESAAPTPQATRVDPSAARATPEPEPAGSLRPPAPATLAALPRSTASAEPSASPVARATPTSATPPPPPTTLAPGLAAPSGTWPPDVSSPRLVGRVAPARFQHPGALGALAVHGARVVSAGVDGTLCWWDPATGARTRLWRPPLAGTFRVALAADRPVAATALDTGTVTLWDVSTEPPAKLREETLLAAALALSPGGDRLCVVTAEGEARVFPRTGAGVALDARGVTAAAFTRSGARLLTREASPSVKVFDAATGALVRIFSTDVEASARIAAVSEDTLVLAFTGGLAAYGLGGNPLIWSQPVVASAAAFCSGGTQLLAAAADDAARIDPATGAALASEPGGLPDAVFVAASDDGKTLAMGAPDGVLRMRVPTDTGGLRGEAEPAGALAALALSPDARALAVAGSRRVLMLDATRGQVVAGRPAMSGVRALALGAGARWLATAGSAGIRRERAAGPAAGDDFRPAADLLLTEAVTALAATPDGGTLAVGCRDGRALVLSDLTGTPLSVRHGASAVPLALALAPDGGRLTAVWGNAGVITQHALVPAPALESQVELRELVTHAALAPDAARALTAGPTGGLIGRTTTERGGAARLPDAQATGALAVAGPRLIWSAPDGLYAARLAAHLPRERIAAEPAVALAISPDGRLLAALSPDGAIALWLVP